MEKKYIMEKKNSDFSLIKFVSCMKRFLAFVFCLITESNLFRLLSIFSGSFSDIPGLLGDDEISEKFLNEIKSGQGGTENEYFQFIQDCRGKEYPEGTTKNVHHIVPKHWFNSSSVLSKRYRDSQENLISLSIEDHIKAHEILFKLYKRPQDYSSTLLLKGSMSESRRIWRQLGAKAVNALLKREKRSFWLSDFQKEMGSRSMNREDALEIRSFGGKKGGRNRNVNRVLTKKDRFLFYYEDKPVLCIFNCETGTDVLNILKEYKQTSILRVSPLLTGVRKKAYGWSCKKIEN